MQQRIRSVLVLAAMAAALTACSAQTPSYEVSHPVLSDMPAPAVSESAHPDSLFGEYCSANGSTVLTLQEDGTFVASTVTPLVTVCNCAGEPIRISEQSRGRFSADGDVCELTVDEILIAAHGSENDDDELIQKNAALMTDDEKWIELFRRMLSGEVLSGTEICDTEWLQEPFCITLDPENGVFSRYKGAQTSDESE